MMQTALQSLERLRDYCEAEHHEGWDPYDGLNSRLFRAIPLAGRSAIARLVWIQLFKRCPLNLRPLVGVPKQANAKGIGLFLQGYCNLYRAARLSASTASALGGEEKLRARITEMADRLLLMQSSGTSGAAWGYNFPWQCRREFLFPAHEPTVVATNFCATALLDAYELTDDARYRDTALSSARFVLDDLRRTPHNGGFIFSYSRMPGNDTIYNASLLGSRLLSYCHKYTGNADEAEAARLSALACCADQRYDGSWTYGIKPVTGWIDSFHTGYNLDGLTAYTELTGDTSFSDNIDCGFAYYINNFFMPDGAPKYYNDRQYPIDIHCPGQLFVTLSRLHRYGEYRDMARRVLEWTMANMQHKRGYFYYQLKPGVPSRISYMRWSNAFMFAALSFVILEESRLRQDL